MRPLPFRHQWSRRGLARWAAGLVIGVGAIWAVVSAAGGLTDAAHVLGRTEWAWVMAAIAVEAVSYVAMGLRLRRLARFSTDLPRRAAVGLALVVAGFGLLTPAAPVEGLTIAGGELRRRGVSQRQAALTLGFGEWFAARSFVLVAAVNIWVMAMLGDLFALDVVLVVTTAAVAIVTLVVTARLARRPAIAARTADLIGWLQFWRPRPPAEERRAAGAKWHRDAMEIVGTPANRAVLVCLSVIAVLTDMAALWASLTAVGVHVQADVVVLGASAGVLAASVPLLPGGLGLVEAVVPAVLHHFGAPLDAALAGALLYRALGTFLPAAVGAAVVSGLVIARRKTRLATPFVERSDLGRRVNPAPDGKGAGQD